MKKVVLLSSVICLVSCGSSHKVVKREIPTPTVKRTENLKTLESKFSGRLTAVMEEVIRDAEKYLGAPYKYGGVSSSGFDCSGFTFKVFNENDFKLPRRSMDQAETGQEIDIKSVKPGDLLFFATAGGTKVSHVAIVHDIGKDGEVKFIHASSSKGVTISSLNEKYWNKAFLHAQRVL